MAPWFRDVRSGVTDYFIPRIFHPGDSIPYPGGYPGLSVKYPGSGYFIPGSHLGSRRQNKRANMAALTEERYQQLLEYLRGSRIGSAVYPSGFSANDKRGLRQQAATFEEKDGVLFHSSQGPKGKSLGRVIVDPAEKTRLIRACHDGIDGGHFGRDKTLSKVML